MFLKSIFSLDMEYFRNEIAPHHQASFAVSIFFFFKHNYFIIIIIIFAILT